MLFNKTPFKAFARALADGVFGISHGGEFTPPTPPADYWFLIDNEHDYLIDNAGNSLVVDVLYYMVDNADDQLIDNAGNILITQQ